MRTSHYPWPRWMNIRGFRFIYHGCWSDPEIAWHGHMMNIHDLEDPMWELYQEYCQERDVQTTEKGFVTFCRRNADTLREFAQDLIDNGQAQRIRRIRFETHIFSDDALRIVAVPAA